MASLEELMIELDSFNKALMTKKRAGETIPGDELTKLKEMVRGVHEQSGEVEIPELGRLLQLYDLGLGIRYLEPTHTRLNNAFAWLEQQEGADDDEDF